ncbi:MAG: family 3 adenylate cyclase, partial [Chloroflexi bacterium]|nr:family 3 adenylate cyclase [Chloroflexota bacterium]
RSLKAVDAVVASPILDGGATNEQVVGVVYGTRSVSSIGQKGDLSPLHAQLVQVLAASVRAGMSRVQSEAEAARRRVQFEQFVSPAVARELDRDPDLLKGKNREISALFADIRNFSRISERVGPEQICSLVGAIMDQLTTQVRELDGTTVSSMPK